MPRINNHTFYLTSLQTHGQTPRGLNWLSLEHQVLRFNAIKELLPHDIENFSLGDAGCGFGDFYSYLVNKPKKYIGIDSLDEMQKIAREKTECEVLLKDITKEKLPTMDYYICSGALSILTSFETHQFIANCYKSSKKAFVFNALYANKESKTYNYLDKNFIQNIAKILNVHKIVYQENYIQDDITVGFYR